MFTIIATDSTNEVRSPVDGALSSGIYAEYVVWSDCSVRFQTSPLGSAVAERLTLPPINMEPDRGVPSKRRLSSGTRRTSGSTLIDGRVGRDVTAALGRGGVSAEAMADLSKMPRIVRCGAWVRAVHGAWQGIADSCGPNRRFAR